MKFDIKKFGRNEKLLLAKLTCSFLILYLIFLKVDLEKIGFYLARQNFFLFFCAFLIFTFSQFIASLRLRRYLSHSKISIKKFSAFIIYYVGMFFNIALPGGISGDGYIAYYLKKYHNINIKLSIRILLSARGSGLFILSLFTLILSYFSSIITELLHGKILITLAIILLITAYSLTARFLLKEKLKMQFSSARYSFIVQTLTTICAIILFYGIKIDDHLLEYTILFMLANAMTVVPISIGGIGIRELVFLYGSQFIGLNTEYGITISITFFIFLLLSSLIGLVFYLTFDKYNVTITQHE